jgi:hypothetical protein
MMDRRIDDEKRLVPSLCLMPTGVSGVLYPPHSLDGIATDQQQFMKLSPRADDIWLKIASLKRGTLCVQVEKQNLRFPLIPETQEACLASVNVDSGENDRQLQACFVQYPDLLEKVRQDASRLEKTCKVPLLMKITDYVQMIRQRTKIHRHNLCRMIFHKFMR